MIYATEPILPPPARTAAGQRVYGGAAVRRLRFVLRARELGFSMDDVRGLLGLGDGALRSCAEVRKRTEAHLAEVRTRIEDLRRIEAVLSETAPRCSGTDAPDCPILDVLGGEPVLCACTTPQSLRPKRPNKGKAGHVPTEFT